MKHGARPFSRHTFDRKYPSEKFPCFAHLQMAAWVDNLQPSLCSLHHCKSLTESFSEAPSAFRTLGIFLRLRLYGSPERQGVSSGLLGVEGGLIREDVEMLVSLLILRSSRSLKLRLSEVCLKKPGLQESWSKKTDFIFWVCAANKTYSFHRDVSEIGYLGWYVSYRRWGWRWNTFTSQTAFLHLYIFIRVFLRRRIFKREFNLILL